MARDGCAQATMDFFFLTVNQQARATDRKTYEKGWYLDLRSGKEKRNLEGKKLRDDDGWIRQGAGLAQLGILFFRLFSLFFPFAFFLLFSRFSFFAREIGRAHV